jgi:hypothetical protein
VSKKLPVGMLNLALQSVLASSPPNDGAELRILVIPSPPIGKLILRILLRRLAGLDKLVRADPKAAAVFNPALTAPNADCAVLATVDNPEAMSTAILLSLG